jgi:site-specific DNA-methyltransferase (adenine-specific)
MACKPAVRGLLLAQADAAADGEQAPPAALEIYMHAWNRGYRPQGALVDRMRVVESRSRRDRALYQPAIKPEIVMDKILRNVAGRTVIDRFMGTGSTGVVAIGAGRVFTGIEKNLKHFATAVARITAASQAAQAESLRHV